MELSKFVTSESSDLVVEPLVTMLTDLVEGAINPGGLPLSL